MQNITANDFFEPTPFNNETKNQIWMSMLADGHDIICHCNSPFGHLLASIFPPGHQDRNLTIQQILERDIKETQCHSGGGEGENHGTGASGTGGGFKPVAVENEEEDFKPEEIDQLIAAAEEKENTR